MRSNANTMLKWRHLGLFQFLGLCHCWEKSQSHGACVHLSVCTRRCAALARRLRFPVRVWDLREMQAGMGLSYSQVLWCKRECLNALTNKAAGFKKQKTKLDNAWPALPPTGRPSGNWVQSRTGRLSQKTLFFIGLFLRCFSVYRHLGFSHALLLLYSFILICVHSFQVPLKQTWI